MLQQVGAPGHEQQRAQNEVSEQLKNDLRGIDWCIVYAAT